MTKQRFSLAFERWYSSWKSAFEQVKRKTSLPEITPTELAGLIATARNTKSLPKSYSRDFECEAGRLPEGVRSKSKRDSDWVKEKKIEAELLKLREIHINNHSGRTIGTATIKTQQPYLMKSLGQVKPDLIGGFTSTGRKKPVVVSFEVKDGADNCAYALVESCRQIDILRRSPKKTHHFLSNTAVTNSVWGAIIAPKSYYSHKANGFDLACTAARLLKAKTNLRVAFLSWNSDSTALVYQGGNWLNY